MLHCTASDKPEYYLGLALQAKNLLDWVSLISLISRPVFDLKSKNATNLSIP